MNRLKLLASTALMLLVAGTVFAAEPARNEKLLDPASLTAKAPDAFKVRFDTTEGPFVVEFTRAWAPNGVDRVYNLVSNGFYDGVRFFRVVSGFMTQFGIHGDPAVSAVWKPAMISDDPVSQSNVRGTVTFAMRGPNTRTTQLFINTVDNIRLDNMGFSPLGKVVEGMEVVDKLYAGYGEGRPRGRGPDQMRIQAEGNTYLDELFPDLDSITTARIVK